jgi:hypothetical protein
MTSMLAMVVGRWGRWLSRLRYRDVALLSLRVLQRGRRGGMKLPPKRGGIDYKESHAREAEEVRR